jgi:hypothetical protein
MLKSKTSNPSARRLRFLSARLEKMPACNTAFSVLSESTCHVASPKALRFAETRPVRPSYSTFQFLFQRWFSYNQVFRTYHSEIPFLLLRLLSARKSFQAALIFVGCGGDTVNTYAGRARRSRSGRPRVRSSGSIRNCPWNRKGRSRAA